jgi:hypothetical protein
MHTAAPQGTTAPARLRPCYISGVNHLFISKRTCTSASLDTHAPLTPRSAGTEIVGGGGCAPMGAAAKPLSTSRWRKSRSQRRGRICSSSWPRWRGRTWRAPTRSSDSRTMRIRNDGSAGSDVPRLASARERARGDRQHLLPSKPTHTPGERTVACGGPSSARQKSCRTSAAASRLGSAEAEVSCFLGALPRTPKSLPRLCLVPHPWSNFSRAALVRIL